MYKIIILVCIFCNFFSWVVTPMITGQPYSNLWWDLYHINNFYIVESRNELFIVFAVLVVLTYFVKSPEKPEKTIINIEFQCPNGTLFEAASKVFFVLSVVYILMTTRWGGVSEYRGAGQFELSNRQGALASLMTGFYLPFMLYVYIVGVFKDKRLFYLLFAVAIYLLRGALSGGRTQIVNAAIIFFLYYYYNKNMNWKQMLGFGTLAFIGMSFFAAGRYDDAVGGNFLQSTALKIVQCNGSSYFLAMVKSSIDMGFDLGPTTFLMHFVTVFVPSFIYVGVFHMISYERTTFVFDTLYNTNHQSGLGFMMLADFYWCLKYWGYALYALVHFLILKYVSKFIFSHSPVHFVMALFTVLFWCNQRADFGVFLKPFCYTYIFIGFFEFLRLKGIRERKFEI